MIVKEILIEKVFIPQSFIDEERESNIENLMDSIEKEGLLEPILVAQKENGYKLIAGYHRLVACRRLLRKTIFATIDDTEFEDDLDEYVSHRMKTIHENRVRNQFTAYQIMKFLKEEKELYYLKNPGARENEEKALKDYDKAVKREMEINQIIQDAKSESDKKYWKKEKDKVKTIIDKTMPPIKIIEKTLNVSANKAKTAEFLLELENKIPGINKKFEDCNISETKIMSLKKFFENNDTIEKFKNVKTRKQLISLVNTLEAMMKGSKIKASEIVNEGDGVYRIGTKHYISYSDKDYKVRKFDFNTKVNVNSIDVAKATIEMLGIEHLRVLVLCETDEIHNFIIKALGIKH